MRQIEDYIGFQIISIYRAHRQLAEEALGKLGIYPGQEMILLQLWLEEGIPQSQITACMKVEPPTTTKMLQRMERSGLIERRPDPRDARVSLVYLTERGRALEQPVLAFWKQIEVQTLANLSLTEQTLLHRLLSQVWTNLS